MGAGLRVTETMEMVIQGEQQAKTRLPTKISASSAVATAVACLPCLSPKGRTLPA